MSCNQIKTTDGLQIYRIGDTYAGRSFYEGCGIVLNDLRKRNDVAWIYISPACDFQGDAPKTGKWLWGGEELTLNSKGESIISYADYAAALTEEIAKGNNVHKRISIVRA